ncbi:MAG: hypothetical protein IJ474_04980, partial [Mailhella sp.]|nr:hypothetical protein [Mailhella sp.]
MSDHACARLTMFLFVILFCVLCGSVQASAAPYRFHTEWAQLSAKDMAELSVPDEQSGSAHAAVAVLWLIPGQGYYTYAHEPGGEGMPLDVHLLPSSTASGSDAPAELPAPAPGNVRILYPAGTESRQNNVTSRHLHGRTPVFLLFKEAPHTPITLDVRLLACSSKHCFPVHEKILLPAAPGEMPEAASQPWFPLLKRDHIAQTCEHGDTAVALPAPSEKEAAPAV